MHPFAALQHLLPGHALSRCLGTLAASRQTLLKRMLIDGFRAIYRVDLSEAEGSRADDFASFNDFFGRRLLPGKRPIAARADAVVSPADGTVSQVGRIDDGQLLQAKGRRFGVAELLDDGELGALLEGGSFVTIYLAPHNYHRVHAPCAAHLLATRQIPGRLFSVNATTERHMPRLFARNERLALRLEADFGELALVLVGAMIVASIAVAWRDGPVSPYRQQLCQQPGGVAFEKGDEVGAFLMGSTVIALFPAGAVQLADRLRTGSAVRVGEAIGVARRKPES